MTILNDTLCVSISKDELDETYFVSAGYAFRPEVFYVTRIYIDFIAFDVAAKIAKALAEVDSSNRQNILYLHDIAEGATENPDNTVMIEDELNGISFRTYADKVLTSISKNILF